MRQSDILALEHRQQLLEHEIIDALSHVKSDDLMIADLKSRVLFVREEIERLRRKEFLSYH
jgi:hypothetical protein